MCSGDAGCLQLSIKSGIHDEELWQEKKSLISVGKTIVESCPVNNKHYGVIMVLMESHRMLKGQLISKELFDFFNSPKKQTNNFWPSRLGQKLTFSSSFFGRH